MLQILPLSILFSTDAMVSVHTSNLQMTDRIHSAGQEYKPSSSGELGDNVLPISFGTSTSFICCIASSTAIIIEVIYTVDKHKRSSSGIYYVAVSILGK